MNADLKLLKIVYHPLQDFELGCFMSEASALYGFSRDLMPNLQISIDFSYYDSSLSSKKGLQKIIKVISTPLCFIVLFCMICKAVRLEFILLIVRTPSLIHILFFCFSYSVFTI